MGDKNDLALIQLALATKGIASASMNYRYASDTVAYDQLMRDVDTAVEFIVAQGTSWKIDTQNIAIGGASAGAHMALLYAYKYDTRDRISAVISLAGPTDLSSTELLDKVTTAKLIEGVNHMVGVDYVAGTSLDPVFNTVSPIGYVKNIPSLLVHGTKDSIVPYNQATQLVAVLKEKNIAHKLLTINGANHDLGVSNPNNIKKIIDAMAHWIKTYD